MMNREWQQIRPVNGDIKSSFEELVCQLARAESITNNSKFVRVAAPDGGVEAYCILSDQAEYGWQAKFFSSMGSNQWTQIEESFKTAFEKHPNLVKYFICTPLDREDPRATIKKGERKGQQLNHFMDKWNAKVKEWQTYAKSQGREIEFEYWGNSELFERLGKRENEGKLYFWFGKEEFSDEWFEQKLDESIKNLDKRYTPELNFDLPIAKIFDGISRDQYFKEQFNSYLDDLFKYYREFSKIREAKILDFINKIVSKITLFRLDCEKIDFEGISADNIQGLHSALEEIRDLVYELIQKQRELYSTFIAEKKKENKFAGYTNEYIWEIKISQRLVSPIIKFLKFLDSHTVLLSYNPFMLLTGDAGIGKSHLLADVARKRAERNQFSILLLGQLFTTEEPWSQIKKQLQLGCERDVFLGALNAKAETTQSRILIIVDALNEGEGKELWKKYIAGFISAVKRFPNLGVVFSLRTSYKDLIIPETLIDGKEVVQVIHNGFSSHEYDASIRFFDNYGIKQPSIPLLRPEFSNPLFLKLFCEGLSRNGLQDIPVGYEGISTILDYYLAAINKKISEKHRMPEALLITQNIAKKIASHIADAENTFLKFHDAYDIITQFAKDYSINDPSCFFQDLIGGGIFTQNVRHEGPGKNCETLDISYERFKDHLVCAYLLENHFDKNNPRNSFVPGNKLCLWGTLPVRVRFGSSGMLQR